MKRFTALILPVAAAAGLGASASALADETPQAVVEYQITDLTSEAGRKAVRARLQDAASQVCRINGRPSLDNLRARAACIDEALQHAEGELETRIAAVERRMRFADARG